jgi:two-component system, LytTR family, response regulator
MITCIAIDDEPMALEVIEHYCNRSRHVDLKGTFREPFKAIAYLEQEKIDLIFLDINMPDISGMQLVHALSPRPMIIFTTAYSHYAVESYNLNAVDYMLKPIIYERFQQAIDKAAKELFLQTSVEANESTIYLKSGPQTYPVKPGDILYLEKDGNYMTVHLKERRVLIRENMSGVFDLVPASDFLRVHKSFVVAMRHIKMIEAEQLTVGNQIIPIGITYRESVRTRLGIR